MPLGVAGRPRQPRAGGLPHVEVLPHLLPPVAHDGLVLADAQLLAVHQAGALGPGLVLVVGVLLQVLLAEAGLLLVVWLLLEVRHSFPAGPCEERKVRGQLAQLPGSLERYA